MGRYTPGISDERRFPGTSVNGLPKPAGECLLKVILLRSRELLPARGNRHDVDTRKLLQTTNSPAPECRRPTTR